MNWPIVTLLDALASAEVFVDGDWVESKDQDPEGDVRLVQLADVGDGEYLDRSDRFLTSDKARALRCTFLEPGDVLVARMPDPLGRACIFPGDSKPSVTVVDVCIIRPDVRTHDSRWLMHCLNGTACRNQIASYATGTTRSRISRGNLGKIRVSHPPLREQRRIAEILDRADALRTARRAARAQLETLAQAIFLGMFGDPGRGRKGLPCGVLEDACSFLSGFAWKAERFSTDPVGLPIIRIQNVDSVRDSDFVYWPDAYEERFVMRRGDLLLTLSGSFRVAEWLGPDALLNQRIVRIQAKPGTERLWLLHAVRLLVTNIAALGRHALVSNVALADLRQLPLVRPSLDLQREFAERVTSLKKLELAHSASLSSLEALFSALQHDGLRGEI